MEQVAKNTFIEYGLNEAEKLAKTMEALKKGDPYIMIHLEMGPDGEPQINLLTDMPQQLSVMVLESVLARAKAVLPGNKN